MDDQKRIYLAVPFGQKDAAKEAGARWDNEKRIWYVDSDEVGKTVSEENFKQWLPDKDIAHAAQQKQITRPEEEFAAEIRAAGLILEGEPIMDGKFHRVPVESGKRGAKDGAYIGFLDGKPSGHIENFKSGLKMAWTSTGASLTADEMAHLKAEFEASRVRREQETAERQNAVAEASDKKFNGFSEEIRGGTYLERKQVGAHGVRFDGDTVVVPAKDIEGKIWSLQRIPPENGALKLFEKGGKKAGNMHVIGDIEGEDVVLVAEGYATGASIYEATGRPVVVAFDAGNLDKVVEQIKERHQNKSIIIMGDDDRGKDENVGRMRAEQAAEKHGVGVSFPNFVSDDKKLSDFNDLHVVEGLDKVRDQVMAAIDKHRSHEKEATNMSSKEQEAAQKFTLDGKEISQVRYTVRMDQDNVLPKAESADIRFFKGRKEVAVFEGLSREELEQVVGPDNLSSIENGVGANKRGQTKDDQGRVQSLVGKLEKDNLTPEATTTMGLDGKQATVTQVGKTAQQDYGFNTVAAHDDQLERQLAEFERGQQDLAQKPENDIREHAELDIKQERFVPTMNDEVRVLDDDEFLRQLEAKNYPERDIRIYHAINDHLNAKYTEAINAGTETEPIVLKTKYGNYIFDQESNRAVSEKALDLRVDIEEINSIEPDIEQERVLPTMDDEVKRNVARMWLKKNPESVEVAEKEAPKEELGKSGGNTIDDDDVFADRNAKTTYKQVVPKDVEASYLRVGNKFHYTNKPDLQAFEDKGNKLETKSNSERVAADLVKIAHARGWGDINVKGSEEFRRHAWLEASSQGIGVKGYKPTEADRALLEKRQRETPTNALERDATPTPRQTTTHSSSGMLPPPHVVAEKLSEKLSQEYRKMTGESADISAQGETKGSKSALLEGVLLEHGKAKFNFDKSEKDNYYVKYRNDNGDEKIVWGVDLERAMKESKAEVGQRIALENKGRQPVTVNAPVRNEEGKVVGFEKKETHRNAWEVKADAFRNQDPKEAVKQHPDLVNAYAIVKAAELVAKDKFKTSEDQQRFVGMAKESLAKQIEQNKAIPEVTVKNRQQTTEQKRELSAEKELVR